MIKLIRKLLQCCIDRIDAGNSNISEEEGIEILDMLRRYTDKERMLSKYQACEYLNVSRSTFDRWVKEGKLPAGIKQSGFKELFYRESDLRKFVIG